MATIQDNGSILIYRVGPVLCCASSINILSITHPSPLTKLPSQQAHHAGIFKFGSKLVTVCELRLNFGVEPEQWSEPGRIIITELSSGYIGFWVDEIIDVMDSPKTGWGTPPPLIPRTTFTKTLTLNKHIHLYADFEKLFELKQIGYLKSYIEQLNKLKSGTENNANVNKVKKTSSYKHTTVSNNVESTIKEKLNTEQNNIHQSVDKTRKSKILIPDQKQSKPKKSSIKLSSDKSKKISNVGEKDHVKNEEKNTLKSFENKIIKEKSVPITKKIIQKKQSNKINQKSTITPTTIQAANNSTKILSSTTDYTSPPRKTNVKSEIFNDNSKNRNTTISASNKSPIQTPRQSHGWFIGFSIILLLLSGGILYYVVNENPLIEDKVASKEITLSIPIKEQEKYDNIITQTVSIKSKNLTQATASEIKNKVVNDPPIKPNDKITDDSTIEVSSEIIEGDTTETKEEIVEGSITETTEEIVEGSITETTEEIVEGSITETKEEIVEGSITETKEEIVEGSITETKEELSEGSTIEMKNEITKDSVAEIKAGIADNISNIKTEDVAENISRDVENKSKEKELSIQPDQLTKISSKKHKATITKSSDGITITLYTPIINNSSSPIGEIQKQDSKAKNQYLPKNLQLDTLDRNGKQLEKISNKEKIKIEHQNSPATIAIAPSTISKEIIHIVVKGDTLWDIAKFYVNDPYRYPELAQLSNIKNPDLIYPGNRVHIIQIFTQENE